MRHEWKHTPDGPPLAIEEDLSFTIDGHLNGRGTRVEILAAEILRLAAENAALKAHEADIRRTLRIECEELGDNDWPDDLHLGDVIEKHLCRPVAAKIAKLEERERKLREVLARMTQRFATFDGDPTWTEADQQALDRSRALLKEE